MRDIKFRAWLDYGDGSGEMLPNIQNHINGNWAFGHILNGSVENISPPMQYTGLTDKNGVEIYEGDIVECPGYIGVIEFSDEEPRFEVCPIGEKMGLALFFVDNHLKVIGNIHENPDLLK